MPPRPSSLTACQAPNRGNGRASAGAAAWDALVAFQQEGDFGAQGFIRAAALADQRIPLSARRALDGLAEDFLHRPKSCQLRGSHWLGLGFRPGGGEPQARENSSRSSTVRLETSRIPGGSSTVQPKK